MMSIQHAPDVNSFWLWDWSSQKKDSQQQWLLGQRMVQMPESNTEDFFPLRVFAGIFPSHQDKQLASFLRQI